MTFPHAGGAMPPLPPKSLFCELLPPNILLLVGMFGVGRADYSFGEKINSARRSWRKGGLGWRIS